MEQKILDPSVEQIHNAVCKVIYEMNGVDLPKSLKAKVARNPEARPAAVEIKINPFIALGSIIALVISYRRKKLISTIMGILFMLVFFAVNYNGRNLFTAILQYLRGFRGPFGLILRFILAVIPDQEDVVPRRRQQEEPQEEGSLSDSTIISDHTSTLPETIVADESAPNDEYISFKESLNAPVDMSCAEEELSKPSADHQLENDENFE